MSMGHHNGASGRDNQMVHLTPDNDETIVDELPSREDAFWGSGDDGENESDGGEGQDNEHLDIVNTSCKSATKSAETTRTVSPPPKRARMEKVCDGPIIGEDGTRGGGDDGESIPEEYESMRQILLNADKEQARKCARKLTKVVFTEYDGSGGSSSNGSGDKPAIIPCQKLTWTAKEYIKTKKNLDIQKDDNIFYYVKNFMALLLTHQPQCVDSSFLPVADKELKKRLQQITVKYQATYKETSSAFRSKSIPFLLSDFSYGAVIRCTMKWLWNDKMKKHETTFEIVDKNGPLIDHVTEILKAACGQIGDQKQKWKKLLDTFVDKKDEERAINYAGIVKENYRELHPSIIGASEYPPFNKLMCTEDDIKPSTLFLQAIVGYNKYTSKPFTCLELVESNDKRVRLVEASLVDGFPDAQVYVCVNNFKLLYTDQHTCYLKGFVQWALKIPETL